MLHVYFPDGRALLCKEFRVRESGERLWGSVAKPGQKKNVIYHNERGEVWVKICSDQYLPFPELIDGTTITTNSTPPHEWRTTHANLKRAVFELRRVLVDGDGALEARVAACLGIKL